MGTKSLHPQGCSIARPINLLTAVQVRTLRPGRHADGKGLYLLVKAEGGASWVCRYKQAGKARDAGLGAARGAEAVPLGEARTRRDTIWTMHRGGIDPLADKAATKARAAAEAQDQRARAVTFQAAAEAYILANEAGWSNIKHKAQWRATLTAYAYPLLGALPVAEVGTPHVLAALEAIWRTKPETATRVRSRIELVLDYARVREWRTGENPARWRGHLAQLLPKRSKVAAVKHHAALPWGEVPAFMATLAALDGMGAQALRFAILAAARTGEVIGATWAEIDLAEKTWTIPAARMKAKREHRVPLAPTALAILADVAKLRASDDPALPLFSGQGGKRGLSNMSLLAVLRRMKRGDVTTHGFRSAFRDWASERTTYGPEVAEMALAHAVGDRVEAAYRRGDLFAKRRGLMDDWSTFATTPASDEAGKVVSLFSRDTADTSDTRGDFGTRSTRFGADNAPEKVGGGR